MIPTVLWILYYFLSLKNDVNVPSKSNKQKNFVDVTDENSRIRIRIRIHKSEVWIRGYGSAPKNSSIRNTGHNE